MSQRFPLLFSPLKIGSVTIRNRIVFTAHSTLYMEEHLFGEREKHYYMERAKGGVGLIVAGQIVVHPTCGFSRPVGYLEDVIPRYKMLSDAAHEYGAKMVVQLNHLGTGVDAGFDTWHEIWAPSVTPSPKFRNTLPKEMEIEDIDEVVQGFLMSAKNAQAGGMDGVELQAAHGYLVSSFLSPFSNRRKDEYGGSLENRLRLLMRIIEGVRGECGEDFVVGIRLNGDDFVENGLTLADSRDIALRLQETGGIDYISVSAGSYLSAPLAAGPMLVPPGALVYLAAGIKDIVRKIPVVTVGRINDPVQAEDILANGYADMIGMTRALICDPEFPNKAHQGRIEDIRPCVGCNQGCISRLFKGRPITCIHNAAAGREKKMGMGTTKRSPVPKTVVVVGGGPAGLETARIAGTRGHAVILCEEDNRLGGQVNIASKAPLREELDGIVRYLTHQVTSLDNVEIHLETEVTPDLIEQIAPDAVVVATGSVPSQTGVFPLRPYSDSIPGVEQDNVITAWDVFGEKPTIGHNIVVIDELGDQQGASVVDYLVEQGKKVEVLTTLSMVGVDLVATRDQSFLYKKWLGRGTRLSPYTGVKAIGGRTIITYNLYSGEEREIENVDTVVLVGSRANDELYWRLKGRVKELYRVGDCVSPRGISSAIYEGNIVGRKV